MYYANMNINLRAENLTRIRSEIMINGGTSIEIRKKQCVCKRLDMESGIYSCENGKLVGSINDNSVIMCHKIIDITKTVKNIFMRER